jgi:CheY-like chemotaxis protein
LVERTRDIDLAIVDFAMPGMNGVEVAQQAKQKRPGLPILFITGFVDHAALAGIEEAEILGKPSPLPIWRIRSGSHSRATVKPMWSV